ncbi:MULTISPECIES: thiamine-phosphate kinase [unclassified Campylobacter]|uniref:thiamine-phosphate kinase n=1 Tax=unclassified Campylobacter TaxID=2593542 RepID=UPI0022E9E63E|nr:MULTISPECIES: thiamine-phosphate kinase [unclassified Campylobacter]MDA3055469.1 thiamine-phosphate kinase [Campylobacter sp. CN_NA1]MDA3064841.1 thiamine-phosphate kinase [Campylobacter sp. CN_NE4]MDA3068335.1 thiamine-phosphate kinase [Campylobacter sp. CN_NE3]MDA3082352.1 thiamine-phosphate kinase [Campylobacter sp. CN_EL2]MDA3083987.1 thiamine-phosphate kinase [Campylobacter sp. CN_NE1]
MDKESFVISKFENSFNGDDGAVVGKWVFSKDLFSENIHFRRDYMSLREIAVKSMLVNISDAIAMNAKPKFALLGLTLPKNITESEICELTNGFNDTARKFGIKIIGGDTICGEKIDISVTIISKTKKAVFRKGAKNGDFIAFTGKLGSVKKEFEYLENLREKGLKFNEIRNEFDKKFVNSKFIKPNLRGDFFYKSAKFIRSAMDLSDGLGVDLDRFLRINALGISFLKEISKGEFASGEEYEILFAFSPKNRDKILKIAKECGVEITIFGRLEKLNEKTKFINSVKNHHF